VYSSICDLILILEDSSTDSSKSFISSDRKAFDKSGEEASCIYVVLLIAAEVVAVSYGTTDLMIEVETILEVEVGKQ